MVKLLTPNLFCLFTAIHWPAYIMTSFLTNTAYYDIKCYTNTKEQLGDLFRAVFFDGTTENVGTLTKLSGGGLVLFEFFNRSTSNGCSLITVGFDKQIERIANFSDANGYITIATNVQSDCFKDERIIEAVNKLKSKPIDKPFVFAIAAGATNKNTIMDDRHRLFFMAIQKGNAEKIYQYYDPSSIEPIQCRVLANPSQSNGKGGDDSSSDDSMLSNFSKTSVLFVSVSFIILMVISLAWLVFYYVQRFRYAHAKDRLARRLFNAAKKALTKIPAKTLKIGDRELDSECPVCIEPYRSNDVVRTLPCKHIFHKTCVDPWLLEHRTCPMCKMDILKAFGYSFARSEDSVQHFEADQISAEGTSTDRRDSYPLPLPTESDIHDPFFPSPAPSPTILQPVINASNAQTFSIVPLTVYGTTGIASNRNSASSSDSCESLSRAAAGSTSAEIHHCPKVEDSPAAAAASFSGSSRRASGHARHSAYSNAVPLVPVTAPVRVKPAYSYPSFRFSAHNGKSQPSLTKSDDHASLESI